MPRYPDTEPYDTGLLDTGDGNLVYWETCGNPDGVPALIVHGGPGSGCSTGNRRSLDPERFRIILFDQRNCGRSLPHASDPAADMSLNTTEHLLGDMERLREHLGVQSWLLRGGSWGVTLSLAYAERHPDRVSGMLMLSVTSTRRLELDWLYRGVGRFFPEAWARFRDFAGLADVYRLPTDGTPPISGLLQAYAQMMEDPDPGIRSRAATEWLAWEDAVISQESSGSPGAYSDRPDDAKLAFVRICSHYFAHDGFLADGVLIREAGTLAGIPGVLIHGRDDLGGGAYTPWELARAWPGAELIIIEGSGHTGSTTMTEQMHAAAGRLYEQITGLPWRYDRMGQPAARAAATRHGAGLGARLPVRGVRTRVPAFRVRTGPAEACYCAGAPQAGCRHARPAGTGGTAVRVPRVRRAAPSAVPQPGVPSALRADSC
jgi:proline iminopeptidase